MQKFFSFNFLHLNVLVFIASFGICYATDFSISHSIKPEPVLLSATATSTSLSEFEGHYKVGTTSCKVVPIKMAFEVKWLKGQGIMHFFFYKTTSDGKSVFVSENFGKGSDQFIFDDNNYNTGKFIRADGKLFNVKRMKNLN